MGGPQSPDEDRETFPYYDPQAEIELIQKAMEGWIVILLESVLVPSSCLLLMARIHEHSPEREIGVFPGDPNA